MDEEKILDAQSSEGYTDEIDAELDILQKELDKILSEGETSGSQPEEAAPSQQEEVEKTEQSEKTVQPKRGDLSKAVVEKNRKIKELKEKIREYEEKLKTQEEQATKTEKKVETTSPNPDEVQKRIAEINDFCNKLEEKYPDFDRVKVLLDVYKKTGGIVNDLSIIEDIYLSEMYKSQGMSVEDARKLASTETPSSIPNSKNYEPRSIEEAFEMLKKYK